VDYSSPLLRLSKAYEDIAIRQNSSIQQLNDEVEEITRVVRAWLWLRNDDAIGCT